MRERDDRQATKERLARYREVAKRQLLIPEDECAITVTSNARVEVCEGGAFVDAFIWVPKEKLT